MCIAQKTLKSMPSSSPEINQDNDELDDFIYTPKSGATSPILSPPATERHSIMTPPTEENFHFDQQSTITPVVSSSEQSLLSFSVLFIRLRFNLI
jgi:hypothetical protein